MITIVSNPEEFKKQLLIQGVDKENEAFIYKTSVEKMTFNELIQLFSEKENINFGKGHPMISKGYFDEYSSVISNSKRKLNESILNRVKELFPNITNLYYHYKKVCPLQDEWAGDEYADKLLFYANRYYAGYENDTETIYNEVVNRINKMIDLLEIQRKYNINDDDLFKIIEIAKPNRASASIVKQNTYLEFVDKLS